MLVEVTKQTAGILAEYISSDPLLKLFMFRDALKYGYDNEAINFYFIIDKKVTKCDDILGVAFCIDQIHLYYSRNDIINCTEYLMLIEKYNPVLIHAHTSLLKVVYTQLKNNNYRFSNGEVAILPIDGLIMAAENTVQVKIAQEKDIKRLCKLNADMGEMATEYSYEDEEKYHMKLVEGDGRIYYIEKGGEIVSMAETAFESDNAVYICDVCTHPSYRQKGYTTQIVQKLCADLLSEGKTVAISYENLDAGRIYKKLGFNVVNKSAVMEIKE